MSLRAVVVAGAAILLAGTAAGGLLLLRGEPSAAVRGTPVSASAAAVVALAAPRSPAVAREIAYARTYWLHRNTAGYGDLGGTDCVNFASQVLHARGWAETAEWHAAADGRGYSAAWVSSTAFEHWLAAHPSWATATDSPARLAVGDVAQFDWDDSGDRDHTAIVSRIVTIGRRVTEVDVAEHSPSDLVRPVAQLLAEHGARARVHYWHLRR